MIMPEWKRYINQKIIFDRECMLLTKMWTTSFYYSFFKTILLYMNGRLSIIRSVYTYVITQMVYFDWICNWKSYPTLWVPTTFNWLPAASSNSSSILSCGRINKASFPTTPEIVSRFFMRLMLAAPSYVDYWTLEVRSRRISGHNLWSLTTAQHTS